MHHRSAFILPVAICGPANALAAQIGVDPERMLDTLSVPLVPEDGPLDAVPTHYGCCGRLTEEQRSSLEAASGSFPTAFYARWDEETKEILACSSDVFRGPHGSWKNCLSFCGLKVRQSTLS